MGFYRANTLRTNADVPSVDIFNADGSTSSCTVSTSEEFFARNNFNENIREVLNYISPCVTHFDHLAININKTDDTITSFNMFADMKVTNTGKDYNHWYHPLYNFTNAGVRYYVFAVPIDNREVDSSQTSEPGANIFANGNGKVSGGLGVRIEVQFGNKLAVEGDHRTALYNKLGAYQPCAANWFSDGDTSNIITRDRANEINAERGTTHRAFHMYYDYTQSSVQDALKDVKYIGGVVNDGEKLNRYFLSESSDEFSLIENTVRRNITDTDIIKNIYYCKYIDFTSFPIGSPNPDMDHYFTRYMNYSVMPYYMPEELIGIGKRYILNQNTNTINTEEEIDDENPRDEFGNPNNTNIDKPLNYRLIRIFARNVFEGGRSQVEGGIVGSPITTMYGRGAYWYTGEMRIREAGSNTRRTVDIEDNIRNVYGAASGEVNTSEARILSNRVKSFFGQIVTGTGNDAPPEGTRIGHRDDINYKNITNRTVLLNPTFLTTRKQTPRQLNGGAFITDAGDMNTSRIAGLGRQENREIFANTIANYFAARPNAKESSYISASGISLDQAELVGGANLYSFQTPRGQPDEVLDAVDDDNNIVLGLKNSVRTLSGFGSAQERIVSNAGTSTKLATESRYILGALGDDIYQLAYYQEAGGYVHNVVNTDLNPGDKFDMVAGLFGRHRLYFFGQEGSHDLYALAMGSGRSPKGVSKFTFDFPIHEIFHFTQDKLALRSDSRIYTMDFSKEAFKEDGTPEVYMDDPAGSRTQPAPFMCAIQSLPILEVDGVRPTPFDRMNIIRAAVGTEGFVDFEFSIVNAQGRKTVKKGVSNRKRELEYTSGLTLIEGLHASGTAYPSIRIEKQTSKYLAISSVILENKNSRGQE